MSPGTPLQHLLLEAREQESSAASQYSLDEIAQLLHVNRETLTRLTQVGILVPQTKRESGYDANAILYVQRYLTEEFLSVAELESIFGVDLSEKDAVYSTLLSLWDRRNHMKLRVAVHDVVEIQLTLMALWNSQRIPTEPISLGALADGHPEPSAVIAAGVLGIIATATTLRMKRGFIDPISTCLIAW